jgi:hypothetical protein
LRRLIGHCRAEGIAVLAAAEAAEAIAVDVEVKRLSDAERAFAAPFWASPSFTVSPGWLL